MTQIEQQPPSYGAVSRINHWIVAILIIGLLCVGFFLAYGPLGFEEKGPIRDTHKSIGVLVGIFGLWRVGWRWIKGFLPDASVMPAWQSKLAHGVHMVLLSGIILMPLSGVLGSYFSGRTTSPFGLFTIPSGPLVEWLSNVFHTMHFVVGVAMAIAVLLHIAGALKHHLIDKDPTLERMTRGTGDGRG